MDDPEAGEHFTSAPFYNEHDYLQLPDCGERHYSLSDAALLAALDSWGSGHNTDFPLGDRDFRDAWDDQEVRAGVQPMERTLIAALLRSTVNGELQPTVFARELKTGDLNPDRSYISLEELIEWMGRYGLGRGDLIASIEEDLNDSIMDRASSTANERARFRTGVYPGLLPQANDSEEAVRRLLHVIEEKSVEIAHLRRGMHDTSQQKQFSARERNTLLTVIGALLGQLRSEMGKQDALIAAMTSAHPRARGLSERNLHKVFGEANRALSISERV